MHLDERNDPSNKIIRSNSESVTSRNEKEAKTWPRPLTIKSTKLNPECQKRILGGENFKFLAEI